MIVPLFSPNDPSPHFSRRPALTPFRTTGTPQVTWWAPSHLIGRFHGNQGFWQGLWFVCSMRSGGWFSDVYSPAARSWFNNNCHIIRVIYSHLSGGGLFGDSRKAALVHWFQPLTANMFWFILDACTADLLMWLLSFFIDKFISH